MHLGNSTLLPTTSSPDDFVVPVSSTAALEGTGELGEVEKEEEQEQEQEYITEKPTTPLPRRADSTGKTSIQLFSWRKEDKQYVIV